MKTESICPSCGRPLAAGSPQGLCPECLMKAGFGTGVAPGPGEPTSQPPFVAPTPEAIGRHFPQLEILGFIGQGGMGAVYRARQKELDRVVALKILPPGIGKDPAFAERFTREAKALAKLNHTGIVTLYEFGKADGLFFFLMEFVNGVSLRHLIEVGRIAPREALAIVPQICDALQYAHDQGIVHRDIKPANILLDRQGQVKVADFGLAKLVGTDAVTPALSPGGGEGAAALTEAGKVMGTPQYMAPEQREHPTEVDQRADIYSLGVVFYQMLTGELPGKPIELPSRKVQVDVRLDEVILRALEREPERRYQQVSQVKTDVETIRTTPTQGAAASSATAQPVSLQFSTWSWLETARWSARLLGLSLLLFVAVIFGLSLFGVGLPPLALQSVGTQLNYLAIILIVLGFVVGWKFEGTAAVLIAAGWVLWHSSNGSLAWSMFSIALLVAGLYAFYWWATQGRRTLVLGTAAGVLVALLVCGMMFLPTNIYLYGGVLDAITRRPIPDAELIVSALPFSPNAPKSPAAARCLPSGYYALHVGWYTPGKQVRVTAPGYAPLQMTLGPKALGTRRIGRDFALWPVENRRSEPLVPGQSKAGNTAAEAITNAVNPGKEPPETLTVAEVVAKMRNAYKKTQTYLSVTTVHAVNSDTRREYPAPSEELFAFDRSHGRLRSEYSQVKAGSSGAIKKDPVWLTVINGEKLRHRDWRLAMNKHVEMNAPAQLSYEWLALVASPIDGWRDPFLPFLLGKDLLRDLDGLTYRLLRPRRDDTQQRPGLCIMGPGKSLWSRRFLWLDPKTFLITQITVEESGSICGVMDVDIRCHNGSLDPALFTFEAAGSESVPSLSKLSGREDHPLLGQPAPNLRLQTKHGQWGDPSQADAELTVLYLWTNKCDRLEDLRELTHWVMRRKKPVAICTINIQEDIETVRRTWEEMHLDCPVFMDKDGMAMKAFRTTSLPACFLIHKGKIVYAISSPLRRLELVIDYFLDPSTPKTPIAGSLQPDASAQSPSPDYTKALTAFNGMRGPGEALEKAYARGDLELAAKLTPGLLVWVRSYNTLVRGTDIEVPEAAIELLQLSLEAARSGNWPRAKALFESVSESVGADLDARLRARAREAQRASAGSGSKTTAIAP